MPPFCVSKLLSKIDREVQSLICVYFVFIIIIIYKRNSYILKHTLMWIDTIAIGSLLFKMDASCVKQTVALPEENSDPAHTL